MVALRDSGDFKSGMTDVSLEGDVWGRIECRRGNFAGLAMAAVGTSSAGIATRRLRQLDGR
jgi:hypothetical protein